MGKYIDDDALVTLRNRNNGITFYTLPDSKVNRVFTQNQTKKVPFSEVAELMYSPGGEYMLSQLLVIEDENALKELGMKVEPEYNYGEAEIRKVMFYGTLDEFSDFLNFAPEGALQIAKDIAINEALPDLRKREKLSKKLHFDINKCIEIKAIMNTPTETKEKEEDEVSKDAPKKRLAATPITKSAKIITPKE